MKSAVEEFKDKLRLRLATVDTVPQLALLGVITGLLTGLVIIVFRILIEFTQAGLLPGGQTEAFESLSPLTRLLMSVAGGLLVGLLLQYIAKGAAQVGVVHVMERLAYHQGRLPLRNAIWQFIGAAITLISGHSVGREGPGIHLGAASGSLLGQTLRLPNNSSRILTACGVAAAIAASFNTPLAGVIFSMEVVLMEYTMAGFMPVILAAVSATAVARLAFGSTPAFLVPPFEMESLYELPYVVIIGMFIGALAALFISLSQRFTELGSPFPLWQRTTMAGLVIGLCAWYVPQVMGIGYDTVDASLQGHLGIGLLLLIVFVKLFATSVAIGFGLPGGLIGPTLVIGAAAGGMMGLLEEFTGTEEMSNHAFYALIGMGAMMGATLQAPLSALMAMLELTGNPNIIMPGMLAVIAAILTSKEVFGKPSVFIMLLHTRGLDYRNNPVAQSLRGVGVASIMNRNIVASPREISFLKARDLLHNKPQWLVITEDDQAVSLLPAADLVQYLQDHQASSENEPENNEDIIDLKEIPAKRRDLASLHLQASLQEAVEMFDTSQAEALCICHSPGDTLNLYGVLTRQDIEEHYSFRKTPVSTKD